MASNINYSLMNDRHIKSDSDIKIELVDRNTENNDEVNTVFKYMDSESIGKQHKWSRTIEKTINKYIQKSLGYKSLYYETHFMYSWYHKIVIGLLLFANCFALGFQSVSSTLIITSNSADKTTNASCSEPISSRTEILSIITAVATAVVAIITFIYTQTRFDTYADGCRDAAMAFSDFADDLKTLLTLPRTIRSDPYQAINMVQTDYKKILKMYTKYEIPHHIYKKFSSDEKNKHIILDISDNISYFNETDTAIEQNLITNKFIDSLKNIKYSLTPRSPILDQENIDHPEVENSTPSIQIIPPSARSARSARSAPSAQSAQLTEPDATDKKILTVKKKKKNKQVTSSDVVITV